MSRIERIVPHLWFDGQAEDAARFYTSVFAASIIGKITRFTKVGHEIHKRSAGSVMTVEFTLEGQKFIALNGGPDFVFSEAVSFVVKCGSQEEIDYFWNALSEGGDPKAQQCGWLKDKFGLSWQIVPEILSDLLSDADEEKAGRVMEAMLRMKKLNIRELQQAALSSAEKSIA